MNDEVMAENKGANQGAAQPEMDPLATQAAAWVDKVHESKNCKRVKEGMKRMREDMRFAEGLQWANQDSLNDERYVANLVLRHLLQRRAALYARNPTAVAKRRSTLDFATWDENPATLEQAQQFLMMATQADPLAMDPAMGEQIQAQLMQAQAVLQDYQSGMERRRMLNNMAKTLEVVWNHQIGELQPTFKASMKALVMRALTCGVGYAKIGFHRLQEYGPEDTSRVTDINEQIAALEARLSEAEEGEVEEDSVEIAELRQLLETVTGSAEVFTREGLDMNFPRSTAIIPDKSCSNIKNFTGCRWVAEEFYLTATQVREVYGVDLGDDRHVVTYTAAGSKVSADGDDNGDRPEVKGEEAHYQVFEIWDKHTRQVMTVCDGYRGFLEEPQTPSVQLERFWPYFTLVFNDIEMEKGLYPPSDVRLLRHMQKEHNLSRQRLREHRDAARPGHVASRGRLDEGDKTALENRTAHQVVELNNLAENDDIRRVLQPIPTNPIDPNLYETGSVQEDITKTVGSQEAVLGGISGATATESSIAESSRLSSLGEAVDELDDFLTDLSKSGSHLLLSEFSPEFVKTIAGPGAVWPNTTAPEVAKDLWLEVRAGSSGRPNKALELQNINTAMPLLLQIPGLQPKRLAQEILDRMDDRLDIEEFFDPLLPSVTAMNSGKVATAGGPESDPVQQGPRGGDPNTVEQGDSNLGPRPAPEARNMDPNRG